MHATARHFILLGALLAGATLAEAQVARVLDSRGTAVVQRGGSPARILGAGESLDARDTVSIARDSWALLEFNDRTRITLRPNTVFRLDSYAENAPETMLFGLLKGGFRAVTGLIGKRNPSAVKFTVGTATIGIRGTEFDARVCDAACAAEERRQPALPRTEPPVARVIEMNGIAAAGRAGESPRLLVPGAALYEGNTVATGAGGNVLLAFRDGAQITLADNSRLAINRFRFDEAAPAAGSAYITLYAGRAHVWTGRLARSSPDAFLVRGAIGVIRPHGTGFSVSGCIGNACASVSGNVDSSGASGSASGSAGNTGASASSSAGSGGVTASGQVNTGGGGGASGSLNLGPDTATTQMARAPAPQGSVPLPFPVLPGSGGGSVAPLPSPPGGGSAPPPPPPAGDVVNEVKDTGQSLLNTGQNAATNTQNAINAVVQGAQDVVDFVSRETQARAGAATQQAGQLGQAARNSFAADTQAAITRVQETFSQGAQAAGQQAANAGAALNDARAAAAAGANQVSDAAAAQAVNALNAATAPIIAEMTALLAQLRNNPPRTEAAYREAEAALGQLTQRINAASAQVGSAYLGFVQSDAFQRGLALTEAAQLAASGNMQALSPYAAEEMTGSDTRVARSVLPNIGEANRRDLATQLLGSPEGRRRMEMIGISPGELAQIMAYGGTSMDGSNVSAFVTSNVADAAAAQGNDALSAFFAEAQLGATSARERAEQQAAQAVAAADAKIAADRKAAEERQAREKALAEQKVAEAGTLARQSTSGVAPPGEAITSLVRELMDQARDSVSALRASPDPVGEGLQRLQALREDLRRRADNTNDPGLTSFISQFGEKLDALMNDIRADNSEEKRKERAASAAESSHTWVIVASVALITVEIAKQVFEQALGQPGVAASILQSVVESVIAAISQAANEAQNPDTALVADALAAMGSLRGLVSSGVPATSTAPVIESASRLLLSAATRNRFDERDLSEFAGRLTQLPVGGTNVVAIRDSATRLMASLERAGKVNRDASARFIAAIAPVGTPPTPTGSGTPVPRGLSTVSVLDGAVEVIGIGRLSKGETMSRPDLGNSANPSVTSTAAPPRQINVDPGLFGSGGGGVEEGLYVWVRDGAIQLQRGVQSVDVPAGSAVVATRDRLELLDAVPNFLRFDSTPRPFPSLIETRVDLFRAGDGSLLECAVR